MRTEIPRPSTYEENNSKISLLRRGIQRDLWNPVRGGEHHMKGFEAGAASVRGDRLPPRILTEGRENDTARLWKCHGQSANI